MRRDQGRPGTMLAWQVDGTQPDAEQIRAARARFRARFGREPACVLGRPELLAAWMGAIGETGLAATEWGGANPSLLYLAGEPAEAKE